MSFLSRLNWILSEQFGLSPKKFLRGISQIPWYLKSFFTFKKTAKDNLELMPCLHDRYDESGSSNSEYFWQDLFVAQKVFDAFPVIHLDIGSRIDGFVAHLASFRVVEVIDIRPNPNEIINVRFTRMDLMDGNVKLNNYCDSISCLHALEHFGLGRYGDMLDSNGWKKGLSNMSKILQVGGRMYLSVPVGRPRVVFNAHRVFAIEELLNEMAKLNLVLDCLHYVKPGEPGVKGGTTDEVIQYMKNCDYLLGIIFATKKLSS
jgi:hypothetical protein